MNNKYSDKFNTKFFEWLTNSFKKKKNSNKSKLPPLYPKYPNYIHNLIYIY